MTINTDQLKEYIENMIESHMQSQPFRAECSKCGSWIITEIICNINTDYDMYIKVDPHVCKEG